MHSSLLAPTPQPPTVSIKSKSKIDPSVLPYPTFFDPIPKGPPLFSSHSSAPLSIHLPRPLSSFHSSSARVSVMEADDRQSVARFHLTSFLSVANPISIPDPTNSASRKTHITHCDKTKAFILRAHEFFKENDIADMTPKFLSAMLSIHQDTVQRVISDSTAVVPLNRFPPCGPPPLKRTKKAEQERIKGRFSEETIQQLRRFVHVQFFAQYKRVTLKKICDRSNEWIDPKDKDISISPSILRLLLHAINFSFVKLQYSSNIYMNDYYCRVQSHFLRTMVAIREAGNHLIWSVDETWVHKGMRPSYGWNDMEAAKAPLTFIKNGMTAGNSRQWEKGERLVIVACLSEEGFRCPVIWRTGKKDDGGDYHKEMDSKLKGVFKELVAEADEKNLKPILLMDNASYHSRQYGVQVVRTPPYMAEYAPIEFGWSAMKRAQHDLITHTDDGKKRIEEGALTFCPSLSTEEIVAASDEIMDEADPQPVEDLEELLYMSDDEEEEYSELL
ncbi:hypothetical protein PRIPAC_77490 [Pristionchus pacificus]|uniref:Uncharacterized protein n=1 Tax=Pristionchus pacificus TaxID=54126 RepID=A0A2A6CMH5_PRIPA|nr:hypothetical protein PRIPAC_77490 [Pristionchus pacificus]|eukprot:PDM79306.1 hypothetical protein PRIPAC_31885 [Pristionchus pacificus]